MREYRPNVLNLVDGMLEDYYKGEAPSRNQLHDLRKVLQEQTEELRKQTTIADQHHAENDTLRGLLQGAREAVAQHRQRADHYQREHEGAIKRIAELEHALDVRTQADYAIRQVAQWAIDTEHLSDHVNTDQIGDMGRKLLEAFKP